MDQIGESGVKSKRERCKEMKKCNGEIQNNKEN